MQTNASLTCRTFLRCEDVPWADWERIRTREDENLFMDPRFLALIEATMSDVSTVRYVIVYLASGEPVACTCLSTLRVDLTVIAAPALRRTVTALRRLVPSLFQVNVIFCGPPVSLAQKGVLFAPHADKAAILARLDELAVDLATRERAWFIVFKDYGDEDLDGLGTLLDRAYRRADSLGMHLFDEPFRCFDDYLSSLNAHYRQVVRRSLRKLKGAGVTVARWTDADLIRSVYTPALHRLYLAVVDQAESKLEILPFEFFQELARQFPDEIRLTGLVKDGRVLAFNWSLETRAAYHFLFCGIDYSANREMDLYFNLMYAELGHGLQSGTRDIRVGQTTDTFKARLGCRMTPLHLVVKGVGAVTNRLLGAAFPLLFPVRVPGPDPDIFNSSYRP